MDVENLTKIGVLVVGLVQVIKYLMETEERELTQKAKVVIALVISGLLFTYDEAISNKWVGGRFVTTVDSVINILTKLIAVPGWYGVLKDELLPAIGGGGGFFKENPISRNMEDYTLTLQDLP
jgi:hypothetical protein